MTITVRQGKDTNGIQFPILFCKINSIQPINAGERPGRRGASKPEIAKESQPMMPAGLSPRQVEVVRLVAQGKSNRAIAQILVISERTVANHLASIFNKTGVENRASVAVFAVRHHLTEEI